MELPKQIKEGTQSKQYNTTNVTRCIERAFVANLIGCVYFFYRITLVLLLKVNTRFINLAEPIYGCEGIDR